MSAVIAIARVSLLRAVRRPSTWWLSAIAFVPALLAGWVGALGHDAMSVGAPLLVDVAAPLLTVPWVAGSLGDLFERRVVVYWFTRPIERWSALVGEWLAATLAVGWVLILGGAMLAVAQALTGNASISSLFRLPAAMLVEAAALSGLSVGVAALAPRHPVSATIAVLAVTEAALPGLWAPMQSLSLSHHVATLAGIDANASMGSLAGTAPTPSMLAAAVVLTLYSVLPLAIGARAIADRDLG